MNASIETPNISSRIYKGGDNCNGQPEDSLWNCLYILVIFISSITFSIPILVFPQHNSIDHPEYWYENIIISCLTALFTLTLETVYVTIKYYLEIPSMVSIQVFIQIYAVTVMAWISTLCMTHFFWTRLMGYNSPMPLTLLLITIVFIAQYGTLYILVFKNQLTSPNTKKRVKQFVISRVWVNVVELQYQALGLLFVLFPLDFQWVLAFVLPLVREFNYNVFYRIMIDSLQLDNGKMGIIIGVNAYNALYVAIKIGHTATLSTSICILIVDFVINLHSCKRLIKIHRTVAPDLLVNNRNVKEREYQLSKLILTEIMEIILPLAYIATVILSYYGPNSKILGNIQNDYWQYKIIHDLGELVLSVLFMAVVDSFSAIFVGYWLWKSCSINFLRESCCLIADIWEVPTIMIAMYLNYVSLSQESEIRCTIQFFSIQSIRLY